MQTNTKLQQQDFSLRISRSFNAPRALVFKAWTDKQHMVQWFCPEGFTLTHLDMDVRVGGEYSFSFKNPRGTESIAHGTYQEITPPSRLVYTHIWDHNCSEEDKMLEGLETLVTIDFLEQGDKTLLNFTHSGLPNQETADSHQRGWTMFLDSLAEKIATLA